MEVRKEINVAGLGETYSNRSEKGADGAKGDVGRRDFREIFGKIQTSNGQVQRDGNILVLSLSLKLRSHHQKSFAQETCVVPRLRGFKLHRLSSSVACGSGPLVVHFSLYASCETITCRSSSM